MQTETLSSSPGLAQPYLKAALAALPLPGGRPQALPERELRLDGVTVDRNHLAEYAQVCGFRLSETLPATYLHMLSFPMSMKLMTAGDFPFPLLGLVHVANRIETTRPALAGESFDLRVRATNLRPHRQGRQLDLVTEARVGEELVYTGTSTYLRKGAGKSDTAAPAPKVGVDDEVEPSAIWKLDDGLGRRYAAVSGDRNPIHLHALSAKAFGFPRAIAHGMWSAARCLSALEGRLPEAMDYTVAFRKPILLPSTVAFAAEQTKNGWNVGLRNATKGTAHLGGQITQR
ncbi:MaoC/PaaZ C-terminal domain-containing protein [Rhodococcus sp. X156]|uniref:MaoC family dehydratase n=1 Tax=Rhodococcus sp. X156 TaxID=2499145 RepID=UPI000FDBA9D6|nr:MaoC/PaaZ C-terminal domain-containing protein [Rhodococcus sp. X156]